MGSKNKSDNLLTLEQDSVLKVNSLCDPEFENLSKFELLQKLKESKAHSDIVEEANKKLQSSVSDLEKTLEEQCRKTKNLEEDKSFLRNNIKKASNNWFERKARLSEGENDNDKIDTEINEEIKETSREPSVKKDWAQIFIADETIKLFSELKFKDEQIELSERCCAELRKRVGDYEKVIDDQEVIIHGLENQLDTYFHDNKLMSKQLADLHKLFLDLEAINEKQVNVPVSHQDTASSTDHLPTSEEFKEMSGSVAKTYTKLKELIYEKKSLVTEIERLRTLNVELQNRVSKQETRLISVSDALQTTWLLVSNLKDEHEKIHTAETILRYELKEKREILNRLRDELECSREQWHIIRQKNSETEQEWAILREELNERRRLRIFAEVNGETITPEEIEGAVGLSKSPDNEFEPPIDLLVDMGIEYGVIEADDEESATVVALIDGQDVHEERLQNLEEQCCFLYQKLMSSTARALTLASHLSSLHQHYAISDGDDDDDDDENENEQYFNEDEDDDGNAYESEVVSPDSESYDTAYVSEADGADSASVVADTNGSNGAANGMTEITGEESPELIDEGCDILSRRLITFLPRKIEILRAENKKLEERLELLQEDKTKIEERLNASVEFERRQRKQLEQQLSHLGKCVDELKLERNGKIEEVEAALQKKIEEVEIEAKEHIQLKDEHERMKEKYEERGTLLQITASQLEQTVKESEEKLNELQSEISNLKQDILRDDKITRSAFTQYENLLPFEMESSSTNNSQEADIPKVTPHSLQKEQPTSICEENIETETIFSNNQFKKLVLLTNSCLRIPVYLAENSTLCWSFHIVPQEIRFSITYDDVLRQDKCSSSSIGQHERDVSLEPQQPEDDSKIAICSGIQISRELLPPHSVDASCSDVAGRLVPKVPGHYCLVFHNKIFESQELYVKIWMEESKRPVIQGD